MMSTSSGVMGRAGMSASSVAALPIRQLGPVVWAPRRVEVPSRTQFTRHITLVGPKGSSGAGAAGPSPRGGLGSSSSNAPDARVHRRRGTSSDGLYRGWPPLPLSTSVALRSPVAFPLVPSTPLSTSPTMPPRTAHLLATLSDHKDLISSPPLPDQVSLPDQALYALRELTPGVTEGPYQPFLPEAAVFPGLTARIKHVVKPVTAERVTCVSVSPAMPTGAMRSPSEAQSF